MVRSTKPLSHNGTLIEDIAGALRGRPDRRGASQPRRGRADQGDGHRRGRPPHRRSGAGAAFLADLGQSGILFFNTLFDENAASHIALGQCYSDCFVDGETITPEEVEQRGGNTSIIHIDWMIGSDQIDIDGIGQDGWSTPVMRKGEWA